MFRKVLIPTDFSEWSDAALGLLPALKALGSEEAALLHALDIRPLLAWPEVLATASVSWEELAVQSLDGRRQRVEGAGLRASTRVVEGAPVEVIVRVATQEKADLILMGSHRHSILHHVVLGSVSENVVRHAPVPVLLTRWTGEAAAPDGNPFAHVLFPTDFSPCAEKAYCCLVELAGGGMRRATILHVQDTRMVRPNAGKDGTNMRHLEQMVDTDRLARAEAELRALGVETHVLVREGLPYREVLRAAEEVSATSIVLGSHGKSSVAEILLGSVSAEIIRQAKLPVLVIRRDLDEAS